MAELTIEVRRAMRDLDPRRTFVDDPDWTTERALALLDALEAAEAEVKRLQALCQGLADRVAAQSDLLTRRAEKGASE